jgi:hypothetical protein
MPSSKTLAKIGGVLFIIGMLNFVAFFIACQILGGDAGSGHVEAGKYFLSNHGKLTQTSQSIFAFNLLHGQSIWFTHPLAILGAWFNYRWAKQNGVE